MSDETIQYITTDYLIEVDGGDPTPAPIEYIVELGQVGVQGIPGEKGEPGFSPTVGYILNDNTFRINITNQDGVTQTPNLYDYLASKGDLNGYLKVDGSNAQQNIVINQAKITSLSNNSGVRITNNNGRGNLQLSPDATHLQTGSYGLVANYTGQLVSFGNVNGTAKVIQATADKVYYEAYSSSPSDPDNELATIGDIPTVGNGTITITQGGVTKGTFTTNQSGNTIIDLDAGGSTITNPLEIVGEPYGDYDTQQKITIKAGTGSGSLNDIELGLKPISSGGWLTTSAYLISQINNPLSISNASALGRTLSLNYNTDTLELDANNYLNVKDVFLNKDGSNATNNFKIHNTELTQYSVDISNVTAGGFSVAHANNNEIYARLAIDNSKGSLQLPSISIASYPYSGTLHSNRNEISAYGDIIITNGASYKLYYGTKSANNEVAKVGDIPTTMVGADGTNAGSAGLVPAPAATDNTKFLRGDGTWQDVGGGSSYTAGTGIDITNDVISIDTSVVAQLSDIPDVSNFVTNSSLATTLASYVQSSSLATVATTGNYVDLNGRPNLNAYVTLDTTQTISGTKTFSSETHHTGVITFDSALLNPIIRGMSGSSYRNMIYRMGNDSTIIVGNSNDTIDLKGSGTRPTYNTNSLALYSDIPTVPTNISAFNNDSGYITSSALSGYATETWVGNQGYLTSSDISDMATKTWVGQQGYLTGITSSDVTTALGYTPYSSSNPNGYTNNVGTVTSVNNTQPDANGNVTINLTPTVIDGGNA